MSGEGEQAPQVVVKVEVVEEDGSEELDLVSQEVDSDVEVLKTVASLLSNEHWLSVGSEGGAKLGRRLLDLGEKLEGWRKWEGLYRSKAEQLQEDRELAKETELRFELMKGSKQTLRNTYNLEVERRIKAEREVAELKRNAVVVPPVLSEPAPVAVAEVASEQSSPDVEEHASRNQEASISSSVGDDDDEDSAGTEEDIVSDAVVTFPDTLYNLRPRSGKGSGRSSRKEPAGLPLEEGMDDAGGNKADIIRNIRPRQQRSNNKRRVLDSGLSGRRGHGKNVSAKNELGRQLNNEVRGKGVHGSFSCYVCNERFLHRSNYLQHLKTHPKMQSYRCKPCGITLKNRACLRSHMKIHDSNRKRKFLCPTCQKAFCTSAELAKHLVTHRPDRPFKCPKCPQRFKLAYHVNDHLVTHSASKSFRCELCEKSFKRTKELVAHLRVHTGERFFSCQICKKTFKRSGDLSRHKRTHLGEQGKVHQCPFCSRKFIQKSNCSSHQLSCHKLESTASAQLKKKTSQLKTADLN